MRLRDILELYLLFLVLFKHEVNICYFFLSLSLKNHNKNKFKEIQQISLQLCVYPIW